MKVRALQTCFIDSAHREAGAVFDTNHPLTPGVLEAAGPGDVVVRQAPSPPATFVSQVNAQELLARGALGGTPIISPPSQPTPVSVQLPETVPVDQPIEDLLQ